MRTGLKAFIIALAMTACASAALAEDDKGIKPDITVVNVSANCVGSNLLRVQGEVKNLTGVAAGSFQVTIYLTYYSLDYYTLGNLNVNNIPGNQTLPFDFQLSMDPFYPDGQSYIELTADVSNVLQENNRSNNSGRSDDIYLPCEGPYDLEALEVYFLTNAEGTGTPVQSFTQGQNYYPFFKYRINGASSADAPILIELDGVELCAGTLSDRTGGVILTANCTDPWVATNGAHTLRARLDAGGNVTETNEQNNSVTFQFAVGVTATATGTPTASPSPTPSATPTATSTPSSTPSSPPSATPTSAPTQTVSPTPSPTPQPSALRQFLLGSGPNQNGFDVNRDSVVDIADFVALIRP